MAAEFGMPKSMAPCDAVNLISGGSDQWNKYQGVLDRLVVTRKDSHIHRTEYGFDERWGAWSTS
ncbi:hypothetical protein BM221_004544 [Beauveria bassiana]|uniref:Uncharacterized protein n=1 Tax=Beauveria bassiana TaxID=176275 RepID=A0A2N6NRJ2_BEABA|nr:hypothetical protein BM221_004544 [Beauveria bassiana]